MDSVTSRIADMLNAPIPGEVDGGLLGLVFGQGDHVATGRAVGAWREFSYGSEVHWYRLSDTDVLGYDCVSSEGLPLFPTESELESGL